MSSHGTEKQGSSSLTAKNGKGKGPEKGRDFRRWGEGWDYLEASQKNREKRDD